MNENIQPSQKKIKKFKPNIIDFLIVIIFIGAVVGIVLRTGVVEQVTINNNLETARVSFMISNISETSGNYFSNGDSFYSDTHKCNFGVLEGFSIMPAEAYILNENGILIKTNSINHRVDVRGTMLCEGVFTEDGFFLAGSNYIAPNTGVAVKSANIIVSLTVMNIEKVTDTAE